VLLDDPPATSRHRLARRIVRISLARVKGRRLGVLDPGESATLISHAERHNPAFASGQRGENYIAMCSDPVLHRPARPAGTLNHRCTEWKMNNGEDGEDTDAVRETMKLRIEARGWLHIVIYQTLCPSPCSTRFVRCCWPQPLRDALHGHLQAKMRPTRCPGFVVVVIVATPLTCSL
jgi:hypothetical protein